MFQRDPKSAQIETTDASEGLKLASSDKTIHSDVIRFLPFSNKQKPHYAVISVTGIMHSRVEPKRCDVVVLPGQETLRLFQALRIIYFPSLRGDPSSLESSDRLAKSSRNLRNFKHLRTFLCGMAL